MSASTKHELRDMLENQVLTHSEDSSRAIVDALARVLKEAASATTCLLYEPVKKWSEVNLSSLLQRFPSMRFEFVQNVKNAAFPEGQFDVIAIPLFGFNEEGYRLGHGGGWYDRFLATQPHALKIGVGYESALVKFEPDAHDIPMDIVLTELKTRYFRDNSSQLKGIEHLV
jgi:5-formyltetrahydrofolate cyclo-ligase